jgi:hypothetical protein
MTAIHDAFESNAKMLKATLILALAMLMLSGCKERVPAENTPAFYKLHGIVNDGKTINQITLINDRNNNRPKLRFPPHISVYVITPGTHDRNPRVIRKGFAYGAGVTLELNAQKKLIPIVRTPDHLVYDRIGIYFNASLGGESPERRNARIEEFVQKSIETTDKPEWGLREYVLVAPKTDHISGYEYIPMDESVRSADGLRMWIGCSHGGSKITNNDGPVHCTSYFTDQRGIAVTYDYGVRLLPYWRQIYQEVVNFTDSVIVE